MATDEEETPFEDVEPAEQEAAEAEAEGKMDEEEFQSIISDLIKASADLVDNELSPLRAKATDYYHGAPFGNEEEGRSQVVLTEVKDAVQGALPSLLRVFFGQPESVVEFVPRTKEDVPAAKQATEYIRHLFVEGGGFLKTHAVLKDGMVRKLGVFKWGWEEGETRAYSLRGIPLAHVEMLASDPEVTLNRVTQPEEGDRFDVELSRRETEGKAAVWTIPPEEYLLSPEARSQDEALFIGHRTYKTSGELIAMGIPPEIIEEHGGTDTSLGDNDEATARREAAAESGEDDPEAGEANDKHLYVEGYPRVDFDGDGIAELRRVCTIGPTYHVVSNEPTDERPFAIFCPDPEPHVLIGGSWADRTMDIQLVKSSVLRGSLDSLSASIFPRMAYTEGQANVTDILNTAMGAPIRERVAGAVRPLTVPFVGKEAFPLLEYFDGVIESRTGRNKGATGLDADALQSSTRDAVGAAVSASQAQAEMIARIFAEQTFKPLFRGLLRLYVKNQPRAHMTKLRNEWVEVDPRAWDATMDVTVNVALGTALVETKLAALGQIAAKQESILQMLGPSNPLVTLAQYRHTLATAIELQGYKDTAAFFNVIPADWQPPAPPEPQQSPEMVLAQAQIQIERMKVEKDMTIKEAELLLKQRQMELDDDRERDKQAADIQLRQLEIELKHKAEVDGNQLRADIQRERQTSQAAPAAGA